MNGREVPPPDEDLNADPVELFFDLAFVFAFSRMVSLLVHRPNWNGFLEFCLVFMLVWAPWTQFTWSANAVGPSRRVRVLFLIGTVASLPMGAALTTAFDGGGPTFAASVSVIFALGILTMWIGLPPGHEVQRSLVRWTIPSSAAAAVMLVGSAVGRGPRIALWSLALAISVIGYIVNSRNPWIIRPGHAAERHGLIVIVALGEVIVAMGIPLAEKFSEGEGLDPLSLNVLLASGTFACLLWWAYFDRVNGALEERHSELGPSGRAIFARNVYTFWHMFIVSGVILAAAALEQIDAHPEQVLGLRFRIMFIVGLLFFFTGVVLCVWDAFRRVAYERMVIGVVLLIFTLTGGAAVQSVTLLWLTNAGLFVVLLLEQARFEGFRVLRRAEVSGERPVTR